ncbi:HD domain protein [Treponema primitia ZAS-2]|uniref:HD domain protein n=1 Tax=Treponema primitia (strain ATCC BAA-887 / DSM 12427 / ZAS-2) TaxID=545694 RepID=F5YJ44_TREPZ|nr:HD-GYP domain-containing protein [Treponema primitia]AEF86740.1 HD domain protein [Treponema primitia ZAS-2]
MKDYTVKALTPDSFFSKPVFLDQEFIIAAPEMALGDSVIRALLEWGFQTIQSEGEPRDEYAAEEVQDSPGDQEVNTSPLSLKMKISGDSEQIRRAEIFYNAFRSYVESLFAQMSINIPPKFNEIAERIKALCDTIKKDRRHLLYLALNSTQKNIDSEQNYLASHAVKSTILALIIGSYLKLTSHRLIELGVAAVLHEAGMLSLPPQVYMNERSLTAEEQKAILTHPILGFNILKSFNLPLSVTIAALEHHERENGAGYPRRLTGDKISLYAKIIAVVCSYEAQTSKRPHKTAKDGFEGMVDLLKNEGKQYDDTVIRALVFSLSVYPIGLYVLLSNGRKGQVVDVNPETPRYPIVQILGALTPDGKIRTLETSQNGVHIVRPLVRDELG